MYLIKKEIQLLHFLTEFCLFLWRNLIHLYIILFYHFGNILWV